MGPRIFLRPERAVGSRTVRARGSLGRGSLGRGAMGVVRLPASSELRDPISPWMVLTLPASYSDDPVALH